MPLPKAPPNGTAPSPRKTTDEYTPAQILGSHTRPSRPLQTQTYGYYFHNRTSPRPAPADPAFPARVLPSPRPTASGIPRHPSSAAPAPRPGSFRSARTRQSDRAHSSGPSKYPGPHRASPAPESSPRNSPPAPPMSPRPCARHSSKSVQPFADLLPCRRQYCRKQSRQHK